MADATQLLKELECLPLAISQAGAYIKVTSSSIGRYLRSLSRKKRAGAVFKDSTLTGSEAATL